MTDKALHNTQSKSINKTEARSTSGWHSIHQQTCLENDNSVDPKVRICSMSSATPRWQVRVDHREVSTEPHTTVNVEVYTIAMRTLAFLPCNMSQVNHTQSNECMQLCPQLWEHPHESKHAQPTHVAKKASSPALTTVLNQACAKCSTSQLMCNYACASAMPHAPRISRNPA